MIRKVVISLWSSSLYSLAPHSPDKRAHIKVIVASLSFAVMATNPNRTINPNHKFLALKDVIQEMTQLENLS